MLESICLVMFSIFMMVLLYENHRMVTLLAARTPQPPKERELFGDPLDVWILAKVDVRAAAQTIRRAARREYKLIQGLTDKAGTSYLLFQLCPARKLMPAR